MKEKLFGQNDVQKILCKKGETFLQKNIVPKLKHQAGLF